MTAYQDKLCAAPLQRREHIDTGMFVSLSGAAIKGAPRTGENIGKNEDRWTGRWIEECRDSGGFGAWKPRAQSGDWSGSEGQEDSEESRRQAGACIQEKSRAQEKGCSQEGYRQKGSAQADESPKGHEPCPEEVAVP
jgi:hypothetical protein